MLRFHQRLAKSVTLTGRHAGVDVRGAQRPAHGATRGVTDLWQQCISKPTIVLPEREDTMHAYSKHSSIAPPCAIHCTNFRLDM